MQKLPHTPSWTKLSYLIIEKYLPLIKRWNKASKSSPTTTEASIRALFIKIFYIITSEPSLQLNYTDLLNTDFLKKYLLKSSFYPHSISKFQDIFVIDPKSIPEHILLGFYSMVIHRTFKFVADKLDVTLKSDLRTPTNALYAKSYELKMLVQLISLDFGSIKRIFFQHGGVTALFCEYISDFFNQLLYAPNKKHAQKKQTGSIYTPLWIIELITQRIENQFKNTPKTQLNAADISVGYGGFIESLLTSSPLSVHISSDSIFGYDMDPIKIDILKLNHALSKIHKDPYIEPAHFHLQDSIIQPPTQLFNILVGNPPWGAKMVKSRIAQIADLSEYTTKQYDSFGLFLIRNIHSLKEDGILYLILPETILLNPNYEQIRKFLLHNVQILEIIHLGERVFDRVNMPALILGLRKTKAQANHQVQIFHHVEQNQGLEHSPHIKRDQSDFIKNQGHAFDIFTNTEERRIVEKIDQLPHYRLQELVVNSRGVEIGKKGEVIECYHCNVWLPVPVWSLDNNSATKYAKCSVCKQKIFLNKLKNRDRIILDDKPADSSRIPYTSFLIGEDIDRYLITGKKYLVLNRRGIKYKSAMLYKQSKLLIRKTSRDLLACIDYDHHYTIQVVYQLSLQEPFKTNPFLLEFILGIISSKILQFYYAKKYQYSDRQSFPHHIQKNILNLPIPKIEFSTKNAPYSKFYAQIVFSTLMLMFLSYYKEFQSISLSINLRLSLFMKENPDILKNIESLNNMKEISFQNPDRIIENTSKHKNIQEIIDAFQNTLDNAVERLFLALE